VPPPGYEAPEAPRPPYEEQRKSLGQRLLGPIVAAGVLLAKFGKVALLLLTKAKFLTTSGSMLVSIAAYSLIWGWKFAAGFVALLFVHEMGHFIQMRREGVEPSWMLFIPFLGAAVGARSLGGNALAEARIGLAGPILGSLGAAAVYLWGHETGSELLIALIRALHAARAVREQHDRIVRRALAIDGDPVEACLDGWSEDVGRLTRSEGIVGRDQGQHRREAGMDHPCALRHPADREAVTLNHRLLG